MYLFEARIIDEETGEAITRIFSYSEEGLEEEMGKSKWTEKAIEAKKRNEEEKERNAEYEAEAEMEAMEKYEAEMRAREESDRQSEYEASQEIPY